MIIIVINNDDDDGDDDDDDDDDDGYGDFPFFHIYGYIDVYLIRIPKCVNSEHSFHTLLI